jgi:hypothetical protein
VLVLKLEPLLLRFQELFQLLVLICQMKLYLYLLLVHLNSQAPIYGYENNHCNLEGIRLRPLLLTKTLLLCIVYCTAHPNLMVFGKQSLFLERLQVSSETLVVKPCRKASSQHDH